MERLKIIKELNNVANILEENGRISEASQITNVLIKIAQQTQAGNGSTVQPTQPTPGQPAAQNQTQLTPEQIAANKEKAIQSNKNYLNEMLKLREIAQPFLNDGLKIEYTYDKRGYVIKIGEQSFIQPTIQQLVDEINQKKNKNIKVPGALDNNKYIDEIAKNIASAADWPDPKNDPKITEEINKEYELGYNLLAGTYYIGKITYKNDFIDKKNINDLKDVFTKLGEHYASHNNQFPVNIYQIYGGKDPGDINKIILEALRQDEGQKWYWINGLYKDHPNIKDIQRGFVQEYNRRDPLKQISLNNPKSLNEA